MYSTIGVYDTPPFAVGLFITHIYLRDMVVLLVQWPSEVRARLYGPCKKPPLNISIVQFIGICNFDALIADF